MTDFWMQTAESCPCTQCSANRIAQYPVMHIGCYLRAPGKDSSLCVSHSQPAHDDEKYCICFHILKVRNFEFFHRDFIFYCTKISLAALLKKVRVIFVVPSESTRGNGHIKKYK